MKIIIALDKTIMKKVPHKIVNGYAISLVTGKKFKYKPPKKK